MSALPDRRKQLIRLIHVAKRELKLTDENYRSILKRETGKESCADMVEAELDKVCKRLRTNGFRVKQSQKAPAVTGRRRPSTAHGQAAFIVALWLDLYQLGAVHNNDDAALDAFVKRLTGIDSFRWLMPVKANLVIEALKDWCAREGFVVPAVTDEEDPGLLAKRRLCEVIWKKLYHLGASSAFDQEIDFVAVLDGDEATGLSRRMGHRLRALKAEAGR